MTLLFPAGPRRLSSEAWGWSRLIYEPSPHPAPPVSLVFLIFSSSSLEPRSQSLTLQPCLVRIWQHQAARTLAGGALGEEGGAKGVGEAFGVFSSSPLPYLLPEQPASQPSRAKLGGQKLRG